MRPFSSWPRWAVEILRKVLVLVGVMPGLLFKLDVECWERDVKEWVDEGERGWPCVGLKGVQ